MSLPDADISKFLSYVLRHAPQAIGLSLDREGWADLKTLITCAKQSGREISIDQIISVVKNNEKRRFAISDDGLSIRAVQGHSVAGVTIQYDAKMPPQHLYHGTATRFIEAILSEGVKPRGRHYVHLSPDVQTATVVGKRHGKPVVLRIEAFRMHQEGFRFLQAENAVWLTEHVPPTFLVLEIGSTLTHTD